MLYAVLLEQRMDGRYQASVPLVPGLVKVGTTRDGTLQQVRQSLMAALTTTELVYLDLPAPAPTPPNPWLATAGIFADDPTLEPMLQDIYAARNAE